MLPGLYLINDGSMILIIGKLTSQENNEIYSEKSKTTESRPFWKGQNGVCI